MTSPIDTLLSIWITTFGILAFAVGLIAFNSRNITDFPTPSVVTFIFFIILPPLFCSIIRIGSIKKLPKSSYSVFSVLRFLNKKSDEDLDLDECDKTLKPLLAMCETWEAWLLRPRRLQQQIVGFLSRPARNDRGIKFNIEDSEMLFIKLFSDVEQIRALGAPHYISGTGVAHRTDTILKARPSISNSPAYSYDVYAITAENWRRHGGAFLSGLKIHTLTVEGKFSGYIAISNCWIVDLIIKSNVNDMPPDLAIENSKISKISFENNCCEKFSIKNSYVGSVACVVPELGNPFSGAFVVEGEVELAYDMTFGPSRAPPVEGYYNLRRALNDRGNVRAEYLVRAIEMRLRRPSESYITKAISWLYDFASSYGNAPERAAAFCLLLMMYNGILLSVNDLWIHFQDCGEYHQSFWAIRLCADDAWSNYAAGILMALQPIIDPLSPFRSVQLISPSSLIIVIWMYISNLIVIALLALVVVGIRRKLRE